MSYRLLTKNINVIFDSKEELIKTVEWMKLKEHEYRIVYVY